MSQYTFRVIGKPNSTEYSPFGLVPYTGDISSFDKTPVFMVNSGICFSTFSYDKESFIPIDNLQQGFNLEKDSVVYLDFTVLSNLQVSGCSVKIGKVGMDAGNDESQWIDYPDMYRIRPFDQRDSQGRLIPVAGKTQLKSYLMIGKCSENNDELNYQSIPIKNSSPEDSPVFYYTQYINNDILIMGSNISGVPIIFPMPFFGTPSPK